MSLKPLLATCAISLSLAVAGDEVITTAADQTGLDITIYNNDLALIKDQRTFTLPKGQQTVAFQDVSVNIQPETVLLGANGVTLLEQNFEYDLLTPEVLMNKFVGKTVVLERYDDKKLIRKKATVLANNNGPVLKIGDEIRVGYSSNNIIFDEVPESLRDKPTLTMEVDNTADAKKDVTLSYLTNGLHWNADYVATLKDDSVLDLQGWVTLANNSGSTYKNANLQLVAGNVNRVNQPLAYAGEMMLSKAAPQNNMKQEALFEYHLYSLGRPTTIKNKQQKQVSLLFANDVPYRKRLRIQANGMNSGFYKGRPPAQQLNAYATVVIKNDSKSHMVFALPAGIIRTYKNDQQGNMQFIGEDSIDHTPENQMVELTLGEAFDVKAERTQLGLQRDRIIKKSQGGDIELTQVDAKYEVTVHNAKSEDVVVEFEETFDGNWSIVKESLASEKVSSAINRWKVSVPAKGKTTFTYLVTTTY